MKPFYCLVAAAMCLSQVPQLLGQDASPKVPQNDVQPSPSCCHSQQELVNANARIKQLEKEVAELKEKCCQRPASPPPAVPGQTTADADSLELQVQTRNGEVYLHVTGYKEGGHELWVAAVKGCPGTFSITTRPVNKSDQDYEPAEEVWHLGSYESLKEGFSLLGVPESIHYSWHAQKWNAETY